MLVTDKEYNLEKKYVNILDLMIKRIFGKGTDDVVLVIDGDEGQGKSELAVGTCYYISQQTGRNYDINNIFFDLKKVIEFAQTKSNQIIHFDEAVLGLLIGQRWEKAQQQFIQLVMVARKKRHFIVLCIPKFHRLPPYVIEDRALGLVHVYSRKNIEKGRFCYFRKESKDCLYDYWKRKRSKAYKKYYDFRGTFGEASKVVFTEDEWKEYDKKKDIGILIIGKKNEELTPRQEKWVDQRNRVVTYFILKNNLKSEQTRKILKLMGVDLSATQIKAMVRELGNEISKVSSQVDDALTL